MHGQTPDRRVQKTRRSLHEALVSLIHEKCYDSIVVKEIVARANVGRSAFYTHFAGKDALLASGILEILRANPPRPDHDSRPFGKLLSFSFPVFAHVNRCQQDGHLRMDGHGREVVHEHLRRVLVAHLREDWRRSMHAVGDDRVPIDLLVEYVVGTFILVLNWWVSTRSRGSAMEVDDVFLSLVTPTIEYRHRHHPARATLRASEVV
jgi:AcrR family transcriptional regulator